MKLSLIACALLVACSSASSHEDTCERVSTDMADCLGGQHLDCGGLTDGELSRIDQIADGPTCQVIAQALPLDGDPTAATCRVLGVGCVAAIDEDPANGGTKAPIVLVNGIDTSPLFRWSERIVKTLRDHGHVVYLATLSPYQPPRVRGPELSVRIDEILAETRAAKVNLLCHSLGGLDCRYVASPGGLGRAGSIASVTTVGTAHRGTKVADALLGNLPDAEANRGVMIDTFATIAGDWFSPKAIEQTNVHDALVALSVANANAFNAETPDAEGVVYQSWAGASGDRDAEKACGSAITRHDRLALPLIPFADLVGDANDGFVSVESAKWGEFKGCVPADHMEQLGQKNLPDVNVRTGVDIARFYAAIAADLAARGL